MEFCDWSYGCLRWILGVLFIYSGAAKLLAPQSFAVLIEAFGLVPDALLMPIAMLLPAIELIAGLGLLADIRGSLAIIAVLLAMFVVILGHGIGMGLDVDCGCFGPEDPEAEAFHGLRTALYRDLVMLAVAGFLYAWRQYRSLKPRTPRELMQGQFIKIWTTPMNRKEEI